MLNVMELQQDAENQQQEQRKKLSLDEVTQLGNKLDNLKANAAVIQTNLDELNKEIKQIEQVDLPEALINLGLKNLTLASGSTIQLTEIITASIPETNKEEAHEWLRKNNFGDLIKNTVTVTFGKNEDKYARDLLELINEARKDDSLKCGSVENKESVHFQTLNAWVKNQLKDGKPIPTESISLYIGNIVKIKQPKD